MLPPLHQSHTAIAFYCDSHASFFRMQSTLCGAVENQLYTSLLDVARSMEDQSERDYHLSRYRAVSAPQAATWLNAIPRADNKFTHLYDIHYSLATRLRLGLPLSTSMPTDCLCKNDQIIQSGLILTNPTHFFDCALLRKRGVNDRHNLVRDQFHIAAARAAMIAIKEPTYALPASDGKRPDAQLIYGPHTLMVDYAIGNPTAPSHRHSAAYKSLHTARQLQADKNAKFAGPAAKQGAKFIGATFEMFGGMGTGARELVRIITNHAQSMPSNHSPWSAYDIHRDLVESVACQIQRGNALVIQQGLNMCARPHRTR
jgi:hypothetical protein